MKRVIAIIGKKRVGKDTASDFLCDKLGGTKIALASPIKETLCDMYNISLEQLDLYKNEQFGFVATKTDYDNGNYETGVSTTWRSMLQKLGDWYKKVFGLDFFMRMWHQKSLDIDGPIIVPDVRLKEEQEWLLRHTDPIFVKITRDIPSDKDSTHRTETESDSLGYDVLIENNGTIEELYKKLDDIQ